MLLLFDDEGRKEGKRALFISYRDVGRKKKGRQLLAGNPPSLLPSSAEEGEGRGFSYCYIIVVGEGKEGNKVANEKLSLHQGKKRREVAKQTILSPSSFPWWREEKEKNRGSRRIISLLSVLDREGGGEDSRPGERVGGGRLFICLILSLLQIRKKMRGSLLSLKLIYTLIFLDRKGKGGIDKGEVFRLCHPPPIGEKGECTTRILFPQKKRESGINFSPAAGRERKREKNLSQPLFPLRSEREKEETGLNP